MASSHLLRYPSMLGDGITSATGQGRPGRSEIQSVSAGDCERQRQRDRENDRDGDKETDRQTATQRNRESERVE